MNWLERQNNDFFVKQRNKLKCISRSYFKLAEIDKKFNLIKKNDNIFDIGASPGGWSQYLNTKTCNIIAIDILDTFHTSIKIKKFIQKNIFDDLSEVLLKQNFDVIVSDLAPNISGIISVDQINSLYLSTRVIEISRDYLKYYGSLVIKMFESEHIKSFIQSLQTQFKSVIKFKPCSSRSESREIYIICMYKI